MRIAFRLDATLTIGSGHLMRCLCLGDALAAEGATVQFLCRPLPGHLARLLREHGHDLIELPGWDDSDRPVEAPWPPARRRQDLDDCAAALAGMTPDWLVVDHYGADEAWELDCRRLARRLLAIDDLERRHACDVLVDANLQADGPAAYAGLVPRDCRRLLGPAHALLRPEFRLAHREARAREGDVRRLLVFLGGMDGADATSVALRSIAMLCASELPGRVDVVIGPAHPRRAAIEQACKELPGCTLHAGTDAMAQLCLAADLAIGAGGSATWERCAVGLPTLGLQVAPNQGALLRHAARAGLVYAPDLPDLSAIGVSLHLRALLANAGLRHHLSRRGLETVDAAGAARVVAEMKR